MTARAPFRGPHGPTFFETYQGDLALYVRVSGDGEASTTTVAPDLAAFVLSSSPGSLASIAAEELRVTPRADLKCPRGDGASCPCWIPRPYDSPCCQLTADDAPVYCEPVLSRLLALAGEKP